MACSVFSSVVAVCWDSTTIYTFDVLHHHVLDRLKHSCRSDVIFSSIHRAELTAKERNQMCIVITRSHEEEIQFPDSHPIHDSGVRYEGYHFYTLVHHTPIENALHRLHDYHRLMRICDGVYGHLFQDDSHRTHCNA